MALSAATQEAVYLARMQALFVNTNTVKGTKMYCDNQGAIALVKNPVKHGRSKHIDIRYHFTREHIENGNIVLEYVPSELSWSLSDVKPGIPAGYSQAQEKHDKLARRRSENGERVQPAATGSRSRGR